MVPHRIVDNRDIPMFTRTHIILLLTALLTLQSVLPCCAIRNLLMGGNHSEVATPQTVCPCSCCPQKQHQQNSIPAENKHAPERECPFCEGLIFHSASNDAAAPIFEGSLVLAPPRCSNDSSRKSLANFNPILQQQMRGQLFLNTGLRLLI
ncbi:hypothetical protein V22_38930 [Calycomorphotria hydatis]|uniref:Uncharacterized protein n=1 Tax=Calycomorphotria hydatis TaxID=2528027 RepID=A0A517TE36_9PLAN|nr:hypothetical protein V22_38930 [Calycomorphotria hydatis]